TPSGKDAERRSRKHQRPRQPRPAPHQSPPSPAPHDPGAPPSPAPQIPPALGAHRLIAHLIAALAADAAGWDRPAADAGDEESGGEPCDCGGEPEIWVAGCCHHETLHVAILRLRELLMLAG